MENNGNGHNKVADKVINWKGMSDILRPMEGNKGADVLINPIKPHKDYSIVTHTVLKDAREAALIYSVIDAFVEDEMWDDLQSFMYFLELKLSVYGIGISAFLQGLSGIYSEKGIQGGMVKGKKWFQKKQKDQQQDDG